MPKRIFLFITLIFILLSNVIIYAQLPQQFTEQEEREDTSPMQLTIPSIFQDTELDRDDYKTWKRQRDMMLQEGLTAATALEVAIDPDVYIVGPGDVFTFNIWGTLEQQIPAMVSPEGLLAIPSVGEFMVDGKSLSEVQKDVLEKSKTYYENSDITLTLYTPRFIRVHVSGEVQFPGTYTATPLHRVSQLIIEAGGVSHNAWKQGVTIKHVNGTEEVFDYASYETSGTLDGNSYLSGGDVVNVPAVHLTGNHLVQVEGDLLLSGYYQILPNEKLQAFLLRIKALKRNVNLNDIQVIRDSEDSDSSSKIKPYADSKSEDGFVLLPGDRIVLPANYVYVRGNVTYAGAFRYNANLTARDYAVMAGAEGSVRRALVTHIQTGKKERGGDVIVQPGDTVDVPETYWQAFTGSLTVVSTILSLILAAKATDVI